MVLIVTMQLVNDRGIEHSRNAKGIDGAFAEAARLTRVGRETIRSVFYSFVDSGYETYQVSDPTIRGSGSPLVDRQTVRKLTIMQTKAIDAFIEHRNSSSAAGKVTLDEISKYMQEGPGEDASAPALSEDLRVRIPRSSLRLKCHNLELTREHLRRGWYGGKGSGNKVFEPCNVRGCWETALVEMNKWLAVDKACNDGTDVGKIGVSGKMGNLIGSEAWTATGTDDLNISDMGDDGDYDLALPQTADGLAAEEEEDLEIVQVAAGHLGGLD